LAANAKGKIQFSRYFSKKNTMYELFFLPLQGQIYICAVCTPTGSDKLINNVEK